MPSRGAGKSFPPEFVNIREVKSCPGEFVNSRELSARTLHNSEPSVQILLVRAVLPLRRYDGSSPETVLRLS